MFAAAVSRMPADVFVFFFDRSKYFRGRKVFGDFDIRLEQAEFREINLTAHSDGNCVVDIQSHRGGSKVAK